MDLCVLVVCAEDSASIIGPVLSEMGITVQHRSSPADGLQLLDEEHFDGIVFEYFGDQSSDDFMAKLRKSPKNRGSMLIAVVEAESNARPVFGKGASFALYRPLSSESARLSLQAARGLMRRERRRNSRAPVSSAIAVSYPGGADLDATLHDISDGGTSITTTRALPERGKVYFEFTLPGQRDVVRLSGEVAWQEATGRVGIRFLDVPQASRRLIQSYLLGSSARQQDDGHVRPAASTAQQLHDAVERPDEQKTSDILDASNRRNSLRFPCTISADVYPSGTKIPNRCTLSDISEGGCYVEMPSPLPGESGVEILVRTTDMKFRIEGEVLASHPGFRDVCALRFPGPGQTYRSFAIAWHAGCRSCAG